MRCNKCGNEFPDYAKICPHCGEHVAQPSPANNQTAVAPAASNSKKKKLIIIIAVVIGAIILISLIGSLFSGGGGGSYGYTDSSAGVTGDVSALDTEVAMENPVGTEELQYPGQNDTYKYDVYETYVEITGVCAEEIDDNLVIPSEIESLPVCSIGERAFGSEPMGLPAHQGYGWDIKSVVIPDSVFVIEKQAFCYCTELEKVEFGKSLESLGIEAFAYTALKEVVLPDSLIAVSDSAFCNCEELETVTLGNGMSYVGDRMFRYCTNLSKVNWGSNIQVIGMEAFYVSGIAEIDIPSTVTEIQSEAFRSCENLKEFTIPSSVNTLGDGILESCDSLKKIVIENGVTALPDGMLSASYALEELYIPASVEEIGELFRTGRGPDKDVFTIYGTAGSAAANYASENGYMFELMD